MTDLLKSSNKENHQQTEGNDDVDEDLSIAENEQDLSKEIIEKKQKGLLRTGLTTGTCASAATKAALLSLLTNLSPGRCSNNTSKRQYCDYENFVDSF